MAKIYTYISLFSSAGIGCYGFKTQGFECIATNDISDKRIEIQRYNKKCKYDSGYIVGDITEDNVKNLILQEIVYWKNNEKLKELDVLIATPPCQGISVANHKKKHNEINRNSLILESVILTKDIKPNYFIFENVRGFLNTLCTDKNGESKKIKDIILNHLSSIYNISFKIVNFKDYGANSSRTRTLVIGVKKKLYDISPLDIFPNQKECLSLYQCIGHLPRLKTMGTIDKNDIYHNFRLYDKRMEEWIIHTKEGCSAFDNKYPEHRPNKVSKEGCLVQNANKNGDKYKRNRWDLVAPCIHTRNDTLSSQATIHPEDNRVFSIRELMILMNIPQSFAFSDISETDLNLLKEEDKTKYLKKNELHIRRCIGEAVPTLIFEQIAKKIKQNEAFSNIRNIKKIIYDNKLDLSFDNILYFLKENINSYSFKFFSKIIEYSNVNREKLSAFYTPSNIIFNIINNLPEIKKKDIHILEPSVGAGNFIPFILDKYQDKNIYLDVIDIDSNVLILLKILMQKFYPKVKVNYIVKDFLSFTSKKIYDIVVGNPPYGKLSKDQLEIKNIYKNLNSNNIFVFFIANAIKFSKIVTLIAPKSLLSSPEYDGIRKDLEINSNVTYIADYGEKSFYNVKIETISILINNNIKTDTLRINSFIKETTDIKLKEDVFDKDFNIWLIYINSFFKNIKNKLNFNVYDFFRDRQITKKITSNYGKYRVLKSRNISNLKIKNIHGYDTYIENIENIKASYFLNTKSVLIPNLSYYPRACWLPKNTITDGSVAILKPKINITDKDLEYYSTEEFRIFYAIGRNYSTRSLNIDNNTIKLWGILR